MAQVINLDVKDIANSALVDLGVNLIKNELGTEAEIFKGLVSGLTAGSLSVRGGKATIEAINQVGELPSIAVTSVQYLLTANSLTLLEGGATKPLKAVIGVATQGERKFGKKEFTAKIAEASSYAEVASAVENAPAREKASGSTKVKDIDGAMEQFLKALEDLEDITPKSAEISAEFFEKVNAIKLAVRSTHPAVKGKKSA